MIIYVNGKAGNFLTQNFQFRMMIVTLPMPLRIILSLNVPRCLGTIYRPTRLHGRLFRVPSLCCRLRNAPSLAEPSRTGLASGILEENLANVESANVAVASTHIDRSIIEYVEKETANAFRVDD